MSELKEVSNAFLEQIMVTRTWNARHGGVYVETSPDTPPNSYLNNDPHRDMLSSDGRKYTRINPAYMTRQLSEIADKTHGYKFRIVSLTPINPYNAPDEWERGALKELENGKVAAAAAILKDSGNRRVFKYMAPIKVEDSCIKCHARQQYSHGNVKGGISIVIPMAQYDRIQATKFRRTVFSLLAIGLISFLFISTIVVYLSRRLNREIKKNIEQKQLAAAMELAGATAHEMRQPITVLQNLVTLVSGKLRQHETVTEEEIGIINGQCGRINDIIKKMLNITSYRTKVYLKGKEIMDLDESAKPGDRK